MKRIKQLTNVRRIERVVNDLLFGSRVVYAEPARLSEKINRTVCPKDWDPNDTESYNKWCQEYRLSSVYHIKQTNNVVCR